MGCKRHLCLRRDKAEIWGEDGGKPVGKGGGSLGLREQVENHSEGIWEWTRGRRVLGACLGRGLKRPGHGMRSTEGP